MVFKTIIRRLRRKVTPKQLLVAGVFSLALVASLGLGLATKQHSSAATAIRDCDGGNSIGNNPNAGGGCGSLTAREVITDMESDWPRDLSALATHFKLPAGAERERFAREARSGVTKRDGTIWVDNRVVAKNAWSIGRDPRDKTRPYQAAPSQSTYYAAFNDDAFGQGVNEIPVLVLFDSEGVMQTAVMKPCTNYMGGDVERPVYRCDKIVKEEVAGKKNTYRFHSETFVDKGATITKVEYVFSDGKVEFRNTPAEKVEHTFTTTGTQEVAVKLHIALPGGATKVVTSEDCKLKFEIPTPYYACTGLTAAALDNKNQKFRFTTKMKYGNGATPKSVDFTTGGNTTTGVVTKDEKGDFYKEYTFTDGAKHKVTAKIHFTVDGKDVVSKETCETEVTSGKTPMCTVPGKEKYPPEAPECQEECKPGVPVGSPECKPPVVTPPVMPDTGMGNVVGLFGGVSAIGAIGHQVFSRLRARRES